MGLLLLGLHHPVHSTAEVTAEPTAEATSAIPADVIGKIAFVSETSTDTQLYIMNADGSNVRQLTTKNAFPWSPALSPDGKQIAFAAKVSEHYQIFVMNVDGTNEQQLTQNPTGQSGISGLDWSRDGKQIVFTYKLNDDINIQSYDLYTINVDGSHQQKITAQPMELVFSPHWSPDRSQIVFDTLGYSPDDLTKPIDFSVHSHIYIVNVDGSGLHRLTQAENNEHFPAWSADGKWIAFLSGGASASDNGLFSINPDGTNLTHLIQAYYSMPAWSPDGKYLAATFPELKNGKDVANIYVMNADGSNPIKVTAIDGLYRFPTWSR